MAQFENTFTGKGTGVVLPSGEQALSAQKGMSDMILSAEKLKYDTYKRNEEDFLKASNIDPVFVLANSARDTQAKLLEDFNKRWGGVMKQKGGNLTTDDKIGMAREKDFILMQQQKMTSDMQNMIQHQKMTAQNPNRYDMGELNEWVNEYMKTGKYEHTEPPIKPLSITDAAMKMANKVATKEYIDESEPQRTYNVAGVPYKKTTIYSAKKEDVIPYIASAISSNDQYQAGALKEWTSLTQPERDTYYQKNPSNPILEMTVDRHWKEWVTSKEKEERNIQPRENQSGTMRTWQGGKYTPTSAMASPFPSMASSTYHPFPNLVKQLTIPVANMELLEPDKATAQTERPNQSIKGYVTGYDEASDKITFLISQDYKDLDFPTLASGKGMQVAIPRSNFSKEIFDDLEIIKDGNPTKLRDVVRATPTEAPKKPDPTQPRK